MNTELEIAKAYATKCHEATNHKYDGKPYSVHLNMVHDIALENIEMIPEEDRETVLAACWTHDVIEDCRETYNDVSTICGKDVAEIVYALSNEKGKTRQDRANFKYYNGIKNCRYATFVKCCDRLANIQYSKDSGSRMLDKYRDEHSNFVIHLHSDEYDSLFLKMYKLLEK